MHIKEKKKIFYGWFIVAACIILTSSALGMFNSTASLFLAPVSNDLGFSRAQFALGRTIVTLIGALTAPLYGGTLIRNFGIKKLLLIGSITLSLTTFCYSLPMNLWQLYIISLFNGLFLNGIYFLIIGTLVSNWFIDKKGIATGLAFSGSGLGSAIFSPLVSILITAIGWRSTYRYMAIAGLIMMLPTIIFIVKDKPQSIGLEPYVDGKKNRVAVKFDINEGITNAQAARTPNYWLLMVSLCGFSFLAGGASGHSVAFLTDVGYSISFATSVFSVIMLSLTIAKLLIGYIYDRFGTRKGNIFIGISCIGFPVFALMASYNSWAPWLFGVMLGITGTGVSIPVTILISKHFGQKDFSSIYSVFSMMTTLASSFAMPLMGGIYDHLGSYKHAWVMLLIIGIISSLALLISDRISKRVTCYNTEKSV